MVSSGRTRIRRVARGVRSWSGVLRPELGILTVSLAPAPAPTPPVLKFSLPQSGGAPFRIPLAPSPFASNPVPALFGVCRRSSSRRATTPPATFVVILPAASLCGTSWSSITGRVGAEIDAAALGERGLVNVRRIVAGVIEDRRTAAKDTGGLVRVAHDRRIVRLAVHGVGVAFAAAVVEAERVTEFVHERAGLLGSGCRCSRPSKCPMDELSRPGSRTRGCRRGAGCRVSCDDPGAPQRRSGRSAAGRSARSCSSAASRSWPFESRPLEFAVRRSCPQGIGFACESEPQVAPPGVMVRSLPASILRVMPGRVAPRYVTGSWSKALITASIAA